MSKKYGLLKFDEMRRWILMKKYQLALYSSMNDTFQRWFGAGTERDVIPHEEIYQFLHTIRGTSGTIGLHRISDAAGRLMNHLSVLADDSWPPAKLRLFMDELVYLTNIHEEATEQSDEQHANAALERNEALHDTSSTQTVFIVDDDESYLLYMKEILEAKGMKPLLFSSQQQAIHSFHMMEPDLVMVDLHLQGESGFDFLLMLKERMKRHYIPTTIVSADDSTANRIKAFRLGADDFLTKPFEPAELFARLGRQLERKALFDRAAASFLQRSSGEKKVLVSIVDDDPIIRTMLTEYMKQVFPVDYETDGFAYADGEKLLADERRLQALCPHFVILDRMMPRMDGLEVLQRLRARANGSSFTIIMLTGKKQEMDIIKALELGADDYMTKPFSVKELETRMRKLSNRLGVS